jgi:hypothetical protein
MFQAPGKRKTFVVTCKRCHRAVPTGLKDFSFQSITVECPLCSELRRYLPSDLFLGDLTNSWFTRSGPEADKEYRL